MLNPHQFVGQTVFHVRGTQFRGPIQIDSVETDPMGHGYFIKSGKMTYPVGHGELHETEEGAKDAAAQEKAARAARRKATPKTGPMQSELGRFLGINPTRGQ